MNTQRKPNIQVYAVGGDRELILEGAKLSGLSFSSFCKSSAIKEARHLIKINQEVQPINS